MSTLTNVELVMWSLPPGDDTPAIAAAREALEAHGFRPDRAEDVPDSTAFRRALAALKTDALVPVAYVRKADSRLCGQLDKHEQTPQGLARERVAAFELFESGPDTTYGQMDLTDGYHNAQTHYTG